MGLLGSNDSPPASILGTPIGRRTALRGAAFAGGGLAAAALFGCGTSTPQKVAPVGTSAGAATKAEPGAWDYEVAAKFDGAPFPYDFPEPAGEPQRGGIIVQNSTTLGQSTWDPGKSTAGSTLIPQNTVASRLLGYRGGPGFNKYTVELQPEMATSWEVSPDGMTFTFKLAKNVKWHNIAPVNGRPFTASDVVKIFEYYRTPGAATSNYLADADKITAVDDSTLQIKLKEPFGEFPIAFGARVLPLIPIELVDQNLLAFNGKLIGTGSLIFDNIDPGKRWHFKANPDYFRGKPYADGLDYYLNTNDPAVALPAFRVGQIDAGAAITTKADADVLLKSNPETRINSSPIVFGTSGYAFNLQNPKFADIRVRRAIALAYDRKGYTQKVSNGYGKATSEMGWPFAFDKHPDESQFGKYWRLDREESAKLLAAAGQTGLTFECIVAAPTSVAMLSLQDDLKAANIKVNLRAIPNTDHLALWSTSPQPKGPGAGPSKYAEAISTSYNGQTATANFWYNSRIRSDSPNNHFNLDDPQIDKLAAQQKAELNPQKRREIVRQIWDYVMDQQFHTEAGSNFPMEVYGPRLRWIRWRGPYLAFYEAQDWGAFFHKAWLAQK